MIRSSPRAGASMAKIDSDAPTGVPEYLALMAAMVGVVRRQGDRVEPDLLPGEVGPVGGIERLVVGHHPRDHRLHVAGVVPPMGIVPRRRARAPTPRRGRLVAAESAASSLAAHGS